MRHWNLLYACLLSPNFTHTFSLRTELELPVLIQNGQFYEARLRAPHCASTTGCRAVVEQPDGNKVFNILESFMFTLKVRTVTIWVVVGYQIQENKRNETETKVGERYHNIIKERYVGKYGTVVRKYRSK